MLRGERAGGDVRRRCAAGLGEPGGADAGDAGQEAVLGARGGEAGEGGAQAGVLALEGLAVLAVAGVAPAAVGEEPVASRTGGDAWIGFSKLLW